MIIGLSGKMRVGKTTIANHLLKLLPEYVKKSFGDFLKEETSEKFDYPLEWNYTEEGKNKTVVHNDLYYGKMTVRKILQWWGTDIIRAKYPNHWVEKMMEYTINHKCVIIDDIRFPNEAYFVKQNGFLVRVKPYDGWQSDEYAMHESETALDDFKEWDLLIQSKYNGALEATYDILASFKICK
jgi:hypothetical protein